MKGEMRSCCVFVTGSMGFRCVEREMDGKSTGFFLRCPTRTCLPFVCNSFFANVKSFSAEKRSYEGQRKWNEEEINFIFRCLYTCRDTIALPALELSPFSQLLCLPGAGGKFPSTEIFCTNANWKLKCSRKYFHWCGSKRWMVRMFSMSSRDADEFRMNRKWIMEK